jgi:hypothetical protein
MHVPALAGPLRIAQYDIAPSHAITAVVKATLNKRALTLGMS